jgi:tetratricopeptide (TPR) repeat protein
LLKIVGDDNVNSGSPAMLIQSKFNDFTNEIIKKIRSLDLKQHLSLFVSARELCMSYDRYIMELRSTIAVHEDLKRFYELKAAALAEAYKQKEAELAIFKAERYFGMDSLQLALNGDGAYSGLLDIINEYGNTKAGNRAKYMVGICYLKSGKYDDAIKYLKKFRSRDKLVSVQALGSIGDAYLEKNDMENAMKYYKKAISKNPNELITPVYLQRLGGLCEMQGDWKNALSYYETLQQNYMQSYEAADIEKRIAFVQAKVGN